MARHFSTKDFFRQIPNALLARYFQARRVFLDLDFSAMKETSRTGCSTAWLALPETSATRWTQSFARFSS